MRSESRRNGLTCCGWCAVRHASRNPSYLTEGYKSTGNNQTTGQNPTVENQFDYICKVAMEDERKDYLKALSRQYKRETLFCDMDDYSVNLFSSEDTYPSHFHTFEMDGFTVRIENSLLAEALENLDGKKRDVILRYYFLGFDDTEISKILEVNRSTIQRRRHAGLEFIKKFMEEEA